MIGTALGVTLGFLAAWYRGRVEQLILVLIDVQSSMPFMIIALAVLAFLGNSLPLFIALMGFYGWERIARLARGLALSATAEGYANAVRDLGATQMVIHSPYTTRDYNNLANVTGSDGQLVECVHACIGAAVQRAESQGVVLVMENIEDIDPNARQQLVESFDSAALRVSIDTGHAHYAHCSNGAPPVGYFVKAAGLAE